MPRIKRTARSEALAIALHDIAQPLSAALLSVETALLLLDRQQIETGRERIASAASRLALSNRILHAVKVASGAEPSRWDTCFQVDDVLSTVWGGLRVARPFSFHGDRGFVEAALTGLSLVFSPDTSHPLAVTSSGQGAVRIRLVGRARSCALISVWLRALRKAGLQVSSRPSGEQVTVTLTVGLAREGTGVAPDQSQQAVRA